MNDHPRRTAQLVVFVLAVALSACAGTGGLGSVAKTTQLREGMTAAEVQQLLGSPASAQRGEHGMIWTYSLHEYFKGWVSHHLLLAGEPPLLRAWLADEAEYQRSQAMWLRALATLPPARAGGSARSGKPAGADDCKGGSVEDRTNCHLSNMPQ